MTISDLDFAVGEPDTTPDEPNTAPAPERPGTSPDAPYGRKPDGTPYKRRPYTKRGSGGTGRRKSTAPAVDIRAGLTEMYETAGVLALLRGDTEVATMLIGERRIQEMIAQGSEQSTGVADAAGQAWAKIADQNPAYHAFFTKILQTGVWAEVLNAHMPLVILTLRRKPKIAMVRRLFARKRKPATNGQRPA